MSEGKPTPSLKQAVGALIFAASGPISPAGIRRCLAEAAGRGGDGAGAFASARESDVAAAAEELKVDLDRIGCGFCLEEVAGGFALRSDPACGPWVRHMLDTGRPDRLSRPALETLAVIAYRQPVTRAQIEAVRGVGVDHVMRTLMETQLVRITGRSDLPGRPFLYGTTRAFLEHFGLKDLNELGEVDPGLRRKAGAGDRRAAAAEGPAAAADAAGTGGGHGNGGTEGPEAEN